MGQAICFRVKQIEFKTKNSAIAETAAWCCTSHIFACAFL